MSTILANDTELTLPDFTLVSASAGSGKTHTLTQRYLQFILSDQIPHRNLKNILAITFTNNAALEMKQRILEYLKKATFGDVETLTQLGELVSLTREKLRIRSENLIDEILDAYSDLQVQTIDSFLTRVMKVSALDFGLPAQFDVTLESDLLLDEAFIRFAEQIASDRQAREFVEALVALVNENQGGDRKFIWNPYDAIADEVKSLYKQLSSHIGEPAVAGEAIAPHSLELQILDKVRSIGSIADTAGMTVSANYRKIIDAAAQNDFAAIFDKKLDQKVLNKSKDSRYEAIREEIETTQGEIMGLVSQYVGSRSTTYYRPYVQAYQALLRTLEEVKHRRNEIDLGVASKKLASSLLLEQVPEIYFSLGERIHHYLVDEFQDTNPIQWATLRPLIEESLGKDGSLFIVGDTKQAIFTFRGGDWRIMNHMLTREEFASTSCHRLSLPLNYRSTEAVVNFARTVFHDIVPTQVDRDTAGLSGLTTYEQKVHKSAKGTGFVEVTTFEQPEEPTDEPPEKTRLLQIIDECVARGYHHQDIAILTPKNASAVNVSSWLNTRGIRFLSHSSLDIRTRKITGELLALLRFLDSPIDDLAFASVLLGDIFSSAVGHTVLEQVREFLFEQRQSEDRSQALYTRFREIYPELWQRWFEHLFNVVGYLPVYDLVAEVYAVFSIFDAHGGEEATLVKLLDVIRDFEAEGSNNLKDFLRYAETESTDDKWNIAVARGEDAVTVMTIHKAKGLGFPVVILLLYDTFAKPKVRFIEEDADAVRVLRITKDWAEKNQELNTIYQRDKNLQQVDELNKLYVALTRAQQELYILSIKGKSKAPSKFLPSGEFRNGTQRPHVQAAHGSARVALIIHPPTKGLQQSPEGGRIGLEETKRGEFVHAIFSRITSLASNPREQVDQAIEFHAREIRQSFDTPAIREKILALLQNPEINLFFVERPGREIKNEQDVADSSGELFRLDRLVVDSDSVTVIDFKTGGESGDYFSQVKHYMKLAHELYPALPVRGLLAYIDLNAVRRVE